MLNHNLGSTVQMDGRTCLITRRDQSGHALYGPYDHLPSGRYVVEFDVRAVPDDMVRDEVCAVLDIVAEHGKTVIARHELTVSQLLRDQGWQHIVFGLPTPQTLEYRVFTNGKIELIVGDLPRLTMLAADEDAESRAAMERFPDVRQPRTAFFLSHLEPLRRLYGSGARVELRDRNIVMTVEGVSFHARESDDLRFVDEIFFRKAYNVMLPREAVVIDVGMNIGLVSMLFASKAEVTAVHSFEPFPSTYLRAKANLSLNPHLADKITAYNFGLAGADEELTVLLGSHGDSGMNSIRGSQEGTPVTISVRSAATVLGPIMERAEAAGQNIVMKIDCEGAEFSIFDVLKDARLLPKISALMVEWHRVFADLTQYNLIAPLRREGFIVFDLTQATGNGFFYAVRTAS